MKPEERVMFDWLLEHGKDAKAARSMIAAGRPLFARLRSNRNALRTEMASRPGEVHSNECWQHMALAGGVCECGGVDDRYVPRETNDITDESQWPF